MQKEHKVNIIMEEINGQVSSMPTSLIYYFRIAIMKGLIRIEQQELEDDREFQESERG